MTTAETAPAEDLPPPPAASDDPDSPDVPGVSPRAASGKFSAETRTELAKLRAKHMERLAAGDDFDETADEAPPPPARKPAAAKPAAAPVEAEKAPPVAPVVDSAAKAIAEQGKARALEADIAAREAALQAREAALVEREARYGDMGERFSADALGAMRAIATQWLGPGATEEEIAAEVGDMITDASIRLAGAKLEDTDQAVALRQMKREMRATRAEKRRAGEQAAAAQKRLAEEQAAAAAKAEQDAMFQRAMGHISDELKAKAGELAFLSLEDDPSDLVWRMISTHHEQTGEVIPISEAAKRIDAQLAAHHRSRYAKIAHLLQPDKAAQATAPAQGQQGDHQRRSRPLTNADASEDTPAMVPGRVLSPAEMKRQSFKRLAPHFAALREAHRQEAED